MACALGYIHIMLPWMIVIAQSLAVVHEDLHDTFCIHRLPLHLQESTTNNSPLGKHSPYIQHNKTGHPWTKQEAFLGKDGRSFLSLHTWRGRWWFLEEEGPGAASTWEPARAELEDEMEAQRTPRQPELHATTNTRNTQRTFFPTVTHTTLLRPRSVPLLLIILLLSLHHATWGTYQRNWHHDVELTWANLFLLDAACNRANLDAKTKGTTAVNWGILAPQKFVRKNLVLNNVRKIKLIARMYFVIYNSLQEHFVRLIFVVLHDHENILTAETFPFAVLHEVK